MIEFLTLFLHRLPHSPERNVEANPRLPVGPNEKNMIGWMYERETKREKSLEQIKKQGGGAKKDHPLGLLGWERPPVQQTLGFFPKRAL